MVMELARGNRAPVNKDTHPNGEQVLFKHEFAADRPNIQKGLVQVILGQTLHATRNLNIVVIIGWGHVLTTGNRLRSQIYYPNLSYIYIYTFGLSTRVIYPIYGLEGRSSIDITSSLFGLFDTQSSVQKPKQDCDTSNSKHQVETVKLGLH